MGLTTVLSDDFSGGYKAENWGAPFDGGTYWNNAWSWSKDDVAVRDGVMDLTMTEHADGWWTGGGFNSFKAGKAITYGTIEFDGKVQEAQGTMGVFLTWPSSDNWPRDGEIDVLETPHAEQMFSTHYAGPDGSHWYDSQRSDTYDETQWHHYAVEWLPDRLTIKVDGQVKAEWTDPAEIPDVAHGIGAMGFVGSPADQWIGGAPDGSTPSRVHVQMDNVVMKQWDGQGGVSTGSGGQTPAPAPTPGGVATQYDGDGDAVFDFRAGDGELLGKSFAVEGFDLGHDRLDVAADERFAAEGFVYRPWARDTAEGTVVQWSWDAREQVLVKGVHATLGELTNPEAGGGNPSPDPTPDPSPDPDPAPDPAPEPTPDPEQPAPEDRPLVAGSDGRDRIALDHLHGFDVDLGAGRDTLSLGADHSDAGIFLDAGEVQGDRIEGFAEGDTLLFRGFGEDAAVEFLPGDRVRVSDAGGAEVFRVQADFHLGAGDYAFA